MPFDVVLSLVLDMLDIGSSQSIRLGNVHPHREQIRDQICE